MNDKVEKTIFNAISENVEALSKIFPSAVKDGQVDFDALRQELGKFEEVGTGIGAEKYEFSWNGKAKAKAAANTDIRGRTLRYKKGDGVGEDTTQNIYIEGDNLEALKLLRNSYFNRIKMIYIDPPYNTGNDFVYRDNFSMTAEELRAIDEAAGDIDEDGNRLVKNSKDAAKYHTNWCNMIYPRLKIARDLLTDDGAIFISIDDNEVDNLKKICDEVFGEDNFVGNFIWQKKTGASDAVHVATITEYILCYAKNVATLQLTKNTESYNIKRYKYSDEFVKERGPYYIDNLDRGGLQYSDSMNFGIECPDGTITYPNGRTKFKNDGWTWKWGKKKIEWARANNFIEFRKSTSKPSGWAVCYKNYLRVDNENNAIERAAPHKNLIQNILNANAATVMKALFETNNYFDYAKPVELIKHFVKLSASKSDIVLDFFSGSATTAHAVMQLNVEDGGNRKYIMVQLPEETDEKSEAFKAGYKNICEIGKERIRRAGKKIKDDSPITTTDLDIGFKVFKVADTNIRLFKSELHGEELELWASSSDAEARDFTEGYNDLDVVYELLIRHRNVPLSSKIEVVKSVGERTFIIADTIVVCLEAKLTDTQINTLAKLDPTPKKFIFRDSAFGDDINLKLNTMTELNALIRANTGDNKSAYKVEFI